MIPGFERPIAINHEAIHRAIDLYEVEERLGCFEKVVSAYRALMEKSDG